MAGISRRRLFFYVKTGLLRYFVSLAIKGMNLGNTDFRLYFYPPARERTGIVTECLKKVGI